jgi:hypothetical protein
MTSSIAYRRLRAPREHGQTLVEPGIGEVPRLVAENQALARAAYASLEIGGAPWPELARQARRDLLDIAYEHTRRHCLAGRPDAQYERSESALSTAPPILLAGHQPELFHPGVWFKNFLLSSLAEKLGATPVNLIIDNDVMHAASIRVLRGDTGQAHVETVPFDDAGAEIPYEERHVRNFQRFQAFAEQVDPVGNRLVSRMWPTAQKVAAEAKLGYALSAARRQLETEFGVHNWEAPLSAVCDREGFARFALHLLSAAPRFQAIHNTALAEYRDVHHIRSQTHPVPELKTQGAWHEVPLWIWSSAEPQRRPLYAAVTPDVLTLSDLELCEIELPLQTGRVTTSTVEAWGAAARQGLKLRPRALLTTMFARLFLGDLFVHGIGGAIYDQLTDAIITRWLAVPPPHFLAATATVQLVPCRPGETAESLRFANHTLREIPYHPEAFMRDSASAVVRELSQEKQRWIEMQLPRGQRRARHDAIVDINARLTPYTEDIRRAWEQERDLLAARLKQEQLVGSREFSFCQFDDQLPDLLLNLSQHG